jgi:benzoate membrane transport protein
LNVYKKTNRAANMITKDWSVSAVTAGFLAVLISYSGPLIIFFQAAQSAGVAPDMISSWVWAHLHRRGPVGHLPQRRPQGAGGHRLVGTRHGAAGDPVSRPVPQRGGGRLHHHRAMLFVIGISGSFDRLLKHVPKGIAAGMMAGILFQFGVQAFKAAGAMPVLGFGMIAAYVTLKRLTPRYCMILVLLVGVALASLLGGADLGRATGAGHAGVHPPGVELELDPELAPAPGAGEHHRPVPAGHGDPAQLRLFNPGPAHHRGDQPSPR